MSTGFFYYNTILLSRMAAIIGENADAQKYAQQAKRIKEAFNERYFNSETAQYATGSQASNAFPLFLGMVPEENRDAVAANIVKDIVEKHDGHHNTGNVCTKYLFEALTDRFSQAIRRLTGRGRISRSNITEAMADVRRALLEADVNYSVAKDFCDSVVDKAIGANVLESLHPSQVMVKIVHDELTSLMGPVDSRIYYVSPGPTVIMLAGLYFGLSRGYLAIKDIVADSGLRTRAMIYPSLFALLVINIFLKLYMG